MKITKHEAGRYTIGEWDVDRHPGRGGSARWRAVRWQYRDRSKPAAEHLHAPTLRALRAKIAATVAR